MCVIEIKYNDDDDDDHDDDDDDGDGEIYSDPARVVSISHPKKEQGPNQKKGARETYWLGNIIVITYKVTHWDNIYIYTILYAQNPPRWEH